MNNNLTLEENVIDAVCAIFSQPEMSALPNYNVSDVMPAITYILCELCEIEPKVIIPRLRIRFGEIFTEKPNTGFYIDRLVSERLQ